MKAEDDQVALQSVHLYAHCLAMFISEDQARVVTYFVSRIDSMGQSEQHSHTMRVFLLLLAILRKVKQYAGQEVRKEGELLQRLARVLVRVMA